MSSMQNLEERLSLFPKKEVDDEGKVKNDDGNETRRKEDAEEGNDEDLGEEERRIRKTKKRKNTKSTRKIEKTNNRNKKLLCLRREAFLIKQTCSHRCVLMF